MSLADQAAHAIIIAARWLKVDPLRAAIDIREARNLAAALLSKLQDWDRRRAMDALGIPAHERFLESFIENIHAGRIKWIKSFDFDRLLFDLECEVLIRIEKSAEYPVGGILDIVYGIEDVTG